MRAETELCRERPIASESNPGREIGRHGSHREELAEDQARIGLGCVIDDGAADRNWRRINAADCSGQIVWIILVVEDRGADSIHFAMLEQTEISSTVISQSETLAATNKKSRLPFPYSRLMRMRIMIDFSQIPVM